VHARLDKVTPVQSTDPLAESISRLVNLPADRRIVGEVSCWQGQPTNGRKLRPQFQTIARPVS